MPDAYDTIRVTDAARIIDAINSATALDGTTEERMEYLLRTLLALLERPSLCNLILVEDLDRQPSPVILQRFVHSGSPGLRPLVADDHLQTAAETVLRPYLRTVIPRIQATIRTPYVCELREVLADYPESDEEFLLKSREFGYVDALCAAWAASPGRAILMNLLRREADSPFTRDDRQLMSLMLRAVAPFVDREIFLRADPLAKYDLSERKKEVLLHLLQGDSEKEIAAQLKRSIHTVHTHIKQLYTRFDVSSRGELMAFFVDRAVMDAAAAA